MTPKHWGVFILLTLRLGFKTGLDDSYQSHKLEVLELKGGCDCYKV